MSVFLSRVAPNAILLLASLAPSATLQAQHPAPRPLPASRLETYCNPLDLPYRFQLQPPIRREAADPTMVFYQGEYWLFPSKSGGYWTPMTCFDGTSSSRSPSLSKTMRPQSLNSTVQCLLDGRRLACPLHFQ